MKLFDSILTLFLLTIFFINPAIICAQTTDQYYNRGLDEYKSGNYSQAITFFTKALELNSENADAYYGRGLANMRQENYAEAISDFSRCIQMNSTNDGAYYSRGLAYRAQKDPGKAIGDFSKVIELNPAKIQVYYSRGSAYMDQDDFIKGIPDLEYFVKMVPDQAEEARMSLAKGYYLSANRFDEQFDAEKAIAEYTKSIELYPDFVEAYNNRAIDWFLLKQYDKAWQDVQKIKELGGTVHPDFISELKTASGRAN